MRGRLLRQTLLLAVTIWDDRHPGGGREEAFDVGEGRQARPCRRQRQGLVRPKSEVKRLRAPASYPRGGGGRALGMRSTFSARGACREAPINGR